MLLHRITTWLFIADSLLNSGLAVAARLLPSSVHWAPALFYAMSLFSLLLAAVFALALRNHAAARAAAALMPPGYTLVEHWVLSWGWYCDGKLFGEELGHGSMQTCWTPDGAAAYAEAHYLEMLKHP